jgi:triphosphoribosyl-dephospho-CoA synthase
MKKKSPAEIAKAARQACVLEVSTEKPGNVTPTKSFRDLEYMDFVNAAEKLEPILESTAQEGPDANIGKLIYEGTGDKKNINFGIVMMMLPLAAAHGKSTNKLLRSLTVSDTKWIVKAMQKGKLGGMGLNDKKLKRYDIFSKEIFNTIDEEEITPLGLMEISETYDTLAREWLSDYSVSRVIAKKIEKDPDSIIESYLFVLSKYPDTLIARKCGIEEAKKVSMMAKSVLDGGLSLNDFDKTKR